MRLIDAEALKKAFLEHCRSEVECINHFYYDENIIAIIDNAPTVESDYEWGYSEGVHDTERPKGEWIEKVETKQLGHGWLTTHEIVCSVCGGSGENDENIPQCWKFCPNCGAKMKGGAE